MAKKTIDAIKKLIAEGKEQQDEARKELSNIRKQIEDKKVESEDAAQSGDETKYLKCLDEIRVLEAKEHIQQKKIDGLIRPYTDEEVKNAWEIYVSDYNKQMEKKLKDYRSAVETMEKTYVDMVEFQNEALKTRYMCGEMIGVSHPEYTTQSNDIYYRDFAKMVTIPNEPRNKFIDNGNGIVMSIKMPDDAEYFLSHRILSPEQIGCIVRLHKPLM